MKAVLQNVKTGVVSVSDIPTPILRPGTVLVRNACSLVSAGTERAVMEFSNANPIKKALLRPDLFLKVVNKARNDGLLQTYKIVSELVAQEVPLGYSSAGVALEVGGDVEDVAVGQRLACAGLFVAIHGEVISVPRNLLVPIPEGVDYEQACFVTLGAIALQGVRLADLGLGETVVVYGVGLVGMVCSQLALAAGCRVIGVDIDPRKIEMLRGFGAEGVLAEPGFEDAILSLTGGYGADKVLLCAATKSKEPAQRVPKFTRQKGVLVVVGDVTLDLPRRAYYDKEIDVRISRSYGPGRHDIAYEHGGIDYPYAYVRWTENRNMVAVLDLIARGRLDFRRLVTHRFPIDQAEEAYRLIDGTRREPHLGVVIEYGQDDPSRVVQRSVQRAVLKPIRRGDLRLGVIGAGNFAKGLLLPAFRRQQGVRFEAICTASGISAAAVAEKYDMALATSNVDDILDNPKVDAVVIATRHDSHAALALRALRAGKAVFVEKPLATTFDDLESVRSFYEQQTAAGAEPCLMVGYNRRFSPLSVSLKKVFSGRHAPLAMIYRINAGFIPPTEWQQDPIQGGGRIVGEVCHFIDLMVYLSSALPAGVAATALAVQGKRVPDTVTLTVDFTDGSLGTVHYFSNGDPSLPKEYIEVLGGGICAQLSNFRSLAVYGAPTPPGSFVLSQAKGFEEEVASFIGAVRRREPGPIPFEQLHAISRTTLLAAQGLGARSRLEI